MLICYTAACICEQERFMIISTGMQASNEEAKTVEISKLRKAMELLNVELDAAKLATQNECNKNTLLLTQLELSVNEKEAVERKLSAMGELSKENAFLKVQIPNVLLVL